jgi:hypothetical protein
MPSHRRPKCVNANVNAPNPGRGKHRSQARIKILPPGFALQRRDRGVGGSATESRELG